MYWAVVGQDGAAAPAAAKSASSAALVWVGVLMAVILVGGLLLMLMRRKLFAPEAGAMSAGGIMEDLRRMRDAGQITQEEYDSIRKNMATRLAQGGFGEKKDGGGKRGT
jgi:hypothetical protein